MQSSVGINLIAADVDFDIDAVTIRVSRAFHRVRHNVGIAWGIDIGASLAGIMESQINRVARDAVIDRSRINIREAAREIVFRLRGDIARDFIHARAIVLVTVARRRG